MMDRRGLLGATSWAAAWVGLGTRVSASPRMSSAVLSALAQGRSRRLYSLPATAPAAARVIAWDVDADGGQLAVAGPTGRDLTLVSVDTGESVARLTVPFVGNVDPTASLLRYVAPGRLCWPTAETGVPELVFLDTRAGGLVRRMALPPHLGPGAPLGEVLFVKDRLFLADGGRRTVVEVDLATGRARALPAGGHHLLRFARDWSDEPFALETQVGQTGDPAAVERSRDVRLKPLVAGPQGVVDFGGLDVTSRVVGLPDGGWAIASGARMLLEPGAGSRLAFAAPDGRIVSTTVISRPFTEPTSLVTDGESVFVAFLSGDQPVAAYDFQGKLRAKAPRPLDATALLVRGERLFHVGNGAVGVIEAA